MTTVTNKSIIIYDWDGTLFNSMPIKHRTFSETLAHYLSAMAETEQVSVDAVRAMYIEFSGQPRLTIFERIAAYYRIELSPPEKERISAELTERNKIELLHAQLFPEVETVLERHFKSGQLVYISSSVPQPELVALTQQFLPERVLSGISGIYGSADNFAKGEGHVSHILSQNASFGRADCIMIGDDLSDFLLSSEAGIDFIGIARDPKSGPTQFEFVRDLKDLF